jgi:2-oxo-4-hydroxy-4-carboxy-5-ureidoimidazoline decarboxylase
MKLTLDALNAFSASEFAAALANVFEYSSWIAEEAERARPFTSLVGLRDAMIAVIVRASPQRRLELIRAHPDLTNRTQRAAGLTAESIAEQDSAGLGHLSDAECTLFEQSNDAYSSKFGFPFILCVRRHTKDSILDEFARRLKNPPAREEEEAIGEIGRIASLRLAQLFDSETPLPVNGRLSTHVLDTHAGRPAVGAEVELVELSRHGASRSVVTAATDADGRTNGSLIEGRPVPIGTYELRFRIGAYYARQGLALSQPPFLDVIPVRFGVSEPEAHLHVPLLVTPWSYATYRGS